MRNFRARLASAAALTFVISCTAPRSVVNSPDALPKGSFQAGMGLDVNVPTATATALYGGLESGIGALYDQATKNGTAPITADSLNDYAKALIAYSLDPLGTQYSLYVRYGFFKGVDAGYRWSGGAHALDARWQFMGPLADDTLGTGWRGSIGLQASTQSFELPSAFGLDKLQSLLKYEFNRKDILIPISFGKPFGKRGRFGGFALGAAYDLGLVEYDSQVLDLVEKMDDGTTRAFAPLHGERAISSYGVFANLRGGYRHVFLTAAFAMYYQDYGEYELFGGKKESLSGMTFLPSFAVETRF